MAPKHSAKMQEGCDMPYRENVCIGLPVGSVLMSQQCVLGKVSLNRNTHKTRLCTDQLMKIFSPEALRNKTLYSPRSNDSVSTNSLFAVTLYSELP